MGFTDVFAVSFGPSGYQVAPKCRQDCRTTSHWLYCKEVAACLSEYFDNLLGHGALAAALAERPIWAALLLTVELAIVFYSTGTCRHSAFICTRWFDRGSLSCPAMRPSAAVFACYSPSCRPSAASTPTGPSVSRCSASALKSSNYAIALDHCHCCYC